MTTVIAMMMTKLMVMTTMVLVRLGIIVVMVGYKRNDETTIMLPLMIMTTKMTMMMW